MTLTPVLSHSAFYRRQHAMGIYHPRRLFDKADLERLYLKENKSMQEIATLLGCCHDTIRDQLRYYQIPTRTFTEGVRLAAKKGKLGHPGNTFRRKNGSVLEKGYLLVYCPGHPRANRNGRIREHIFIWERTHRQPLPKGWLIHHLNGIKSDNRVENLVATPSRSHYDLITALSQRIRELEEMEKFKNQQATENTSVA